MNVSNRRRTPAAAVDPTSEAARAMDSLRRVVHALNTATRASQRAFGVSAAQLFVLRQLSATSGQSLSDLAVRTRTTPSSISEVVARLVRRGLIERQPSKDDRRRAELSLTAAGRETLVAAPETVQERLLRGFEQLDLESRTALAETLESWLTASGLDDVTPALFFEPSARGRDANRVELPSSVDPAEPDD
jgi:DNA-binding MarR family transcriptional regulator